MKKALITGINGQDGSYLAEFLLEKGYEVHGILKRNSVAENQTARLNGTYKEIKDNLYYADMTDMASLVRVLQEVQPDEIYNLAAQSHVRISFDQPIYTAQTVAIGTMNLLEGIRLICPNVRMYQASSSEMFGNSIDEDGFQRETTPMNPTSPYGCSKVFGYNLLRNYRNSYNLFLSNGILFNHESPRRGTNFVTNKVVKEAVRIRTGISNQLKLGNLYASRDWGHARDYVYAMWLMLKQKTPTDLVIATNKTYSVKYFINRVCKFLNLKIKWKGKGIKTKAIFNGKVIIECHKNYYRPSEVDKLLGDYSKAKKLLKWKPTTSLDQLIIEMIDYELKLLKIK